MAKIKSPWKTVSSRVAHKNPWYRVLENKVIRPDGKPGRYFVIDTPGPSVFIVALRKNKICLLNVDRYPTGCSSWEIPGGNSDGQTVLAAAKREFYEETGYIAKRWTKAGSWQAMNGVCGEICHCFIAQDLKPAAKQDKSHPKSEGITKMKFFSREEVFKMLFDGQIKDGQSITGIFCVARKLGWIKYKKTKK